MQEVNSFIYKYPELGHEEHVCSTYLVETLQELGLVVDRSLADIETTFRATLADDTHSHRVGLILVYDAVPTIEADG